MSTSGSSGNGSDNGGHHPPAWSLWLAGGAAIVAIVGGLLNIPSQVSSLFTESFTAGADTSEEERQRVGLGWGPERTMYSVESTSPTAALNSLKDNPNWGDQRNFTRCRELTSEDKFGDAVAITKNSQIEVIVLFENASTKSGEDVVQTLMYPVISEAPSDDPVLQMVASGKSATSGEEIKVWDGCQVMSDKPVKLSYLHGSARLINNDHPDGIRVSDEVILGRELIPGSEGRPDGYIHASTSGYGHFIFTVLAVQI